MKISTILLIGSALCSTVALGANSTLKSDTGLKNRYTAELSVVTLNDSLKDIHKIDDINLGYKFSLRDDLSKVFYGQVNVVKYHGNHVGYGALIGAHQSHGMFRPFMEVDYQHSPQYDKLFTKEQLGYDAGVEVHYFPRLSSYIESYDFADRDKRAILLGTTFSITDKISAFANYHFKSKEAGTSAEIGVGYTFN